MCRFGERPSIGMRLRPPPITLRRPCGGRFVLCRRPPLRVGAAGTLSIAAHSAGAPQAGAVWAFVDEEPAATFALTATEARRILGRKHCRQRPEDRPEGLPEIRSR